MPVIVPVATPRYTVESIVWQLGANVSCSGSPDPVFPTVRLLSSTGRAPEQTTCEQVDPDPTASEKSRLKLPCVEETWSVNGSTVPHATVGATQTPRCGGAVLVSAPLAALGNVAAGRVITTPGAAVVSVPVIEVAVVSPMFWSVAAIVTSSPASMTPLPPAPPPPEQASVGVLAVKRRSAPQDAGAIALVTATSSR